MHKFFPDFLKWIWKIEDPREQNKTKYPMAFLVWTGILLFLTKIESRRQINFLFNKSEFIKNLNLLAGTNLDKIAHHDTLAELLKKISPKFLSALRVKMVSRIVRMRLLERFRLLGKYYLITVDGTGCLVFNRKHCEHCLVMKKKGKILYYHNVLEAKLITENGLALSVGTEFIENLCEKYSKQDCELKAFYRLAPQLKKDFPQLNICLLLDGLYAAKQVFDICKKYEWKYIITFKEGSMPATYKEYISLKNLTPENTAFSKSANYVQNFHWVNDIDYHNHSPSVLECNESPINKSCKTKTTKFLWLTNICVSENNYKKLSISGRSRWKTENEGFNIQKNGGYNMEHAFCFHETAIKNFYLLLQIAHIINQLMEKGNLLKKLSPSLFGSIRNIARMLLENLRNTYFTPQHLKRLLSVLFQFRFNSS